ncbi:hypothetical protein V6N11_064759 [Hibiscus sabdariffa]|uniref:Uncharacterized protein n=1 Tax=Hibiscus sabdariffa TaxID=183260 RepID=A0ABR2SI40_9ROSI
MPPRRETRTTAGIVAEGQNIDEPSPHPPPFPPVPPARRGADGVPQAPQGCAAKDHRKHDCPKFAGGSSGHAVVVDAPGKGRGQRRGPFQRSIEVCRGVAYTVTIQPETGGPTMVYAHLEARNAIDVIAGFEGTSVIC